MLYVIIPYLLLGNIVPTINVQKAVVLPKKHLDLNTALPTNVMILDAIMLPPEIATTVSITNVLKLVVATKSRFILLIALRTAVRTWDAITSLMEQANIVWITPVTRVIAPQKNHTIQTTATFTVVVNPGVKTEEVVTANFVPSIPALKAVVLPKKHLDLNTALPTNVMIFDATMLPQEVAAIVTNTNVLKAVVIMRTMVLRHIALLTSVMILDAIMLAPEIATIVPNTNVLKAVVLQKKHLVLNTALLINVMILGAIMLPPEVATIVPNTNVLKAVVTARSRYSPIIVCYTIKGVKKMICNKCNHKLPDDSEFCQYCGNKIETSFAISKDSIENIEAPVARSTPNFSTVMSKPKFDNTYDARKSAPSPNGVVFATSETSTALKKDINVAKENLPSEKLVFVTNLLSVILTFISMVSIIIAMNAQDIKREAVESWSPTVVYIVLFLILGTFLGFAVNSLIKRSFKLIACLSTIPVLATIITLAETSIISSGYSNKPSGRFYYYIDYDIVARFNAIWMIGVLLVLIITLIPILVTPIKKLKNSWHKSIAYREKCYKRIAKMHGYLEKGIITEEEFEKTKSDILKFTR